MQHSPPSLNLNKPSAPDIAHDVVNKRVAPELLSEGHQQRQRPWGATPHHGKIPLIFTNVKNYAELPHQLNFYQTKNI
jgi:hypothetical protein